MVNIEPNEPNETQKENLCLNMLKKNVITLIYLKLKILNKNKPT